MTENYKAFDKLNLSSTRSENETREKRQCKKCRDYEDQKCLVVRN